MILDTSLLIASERKTFDLEGFLATREEQVAIAAITASELLHGCYRAPEGRRKRERAKYVEWALAEFDAVPFGLKEARHHAEIEARLARDGTMIGSNDLLIAATALSRGFALATWNRKEFRRVPGLVLVDEVDLLPFKLK